MKLGFQVFPVIVLIVLGIIMTFLAYSTFKNSFQLKGKIRTQSGIITDKGILITSQKLPRDSQTGIRETTTTHFFYIKLNDSDWNLTTYNLEEDYSALEKNLSIGDSIEVQYPDPADIPGDNSLHLIKKNGEVLLDATEKNWRERIFGVMLSIGTLLAFFKAFRLIQNKQ